MDCIHYHTISLNLQLFSFLLFRIEKRQIFFAEKRQWTESERGRRKSGKRLIVEGINYTVYCTLLNNLCKSAISNDARFASNMYSELYEWITNLTHLNNISLTLVSLQIWIHSKMDIHAILIFSLLYIFSERRRKTLNTCFGMKFILCTYTWNVWRSEQYLRRYMGILVLFMATTLLTLA